MLPRRQHSRPEEVNGRERQRASVGNMQHVRKVGVLKSALKSDNGGLCRSRCRAAQGGPDARRREFEYSGSTAYLATRFSRISMLANYHFNLH